MMFEKNTLIPYHVPKVLYENRYCNQEGFSILICGGKDKKGKITNKVLELKISSFKEKKFPSMVEPHYDLDLVSIKSNILAVDVNIDLDDSIVPVEIYSDKTKTWTHQYINTEENSCNCIGSFMVFNWGMGEQ